MPKQINSKKTFEKLLKNFPAAGSSTVLGYSRESLYGKSAPDSENCKLGAVFESV